MKNIDTSLLIQDDLTYCFVTKFKEKYLHFLNHKKKFDVKKELEQLIEEFGIEREDLDLGMIHYWHQTVIELAYLRPLLGFSCHEIILHNESQAQVIAPHESWSKVLGLNKEDYQLSLETLAHGNDQDWSYNSPFASFPCVVHGQNVRVTLVHACLTRENTSKLYLRKVHQELCNLTQLDLNPEIQDFLCESISLKKNVLICGPTGSGKTTLLKAMLNEIPKNEHLILMEDCAEVELKRPMTTHLVAGADHQEKSLESFCSYAMRLRPDRIVLGEVRGREVAPFLLAMNTGHQGLMATLHANSAIDCVSRIANLFGLYSSQQYLSQENITKLVCQNIDIIIYMEERQISEVIQLNGSEGGCPYYSLEYSRAA